MIMEAMLIKTLIFYLNYAAKFSCNHINNHQCESFSTCIIKVICYLDLIFKDKNCVEKLIIHVSINITPAYHY